MIDIEKDQMKAVYEEIDAAWNKEIHFLKDLVRYPSLSGNERPVQQMIESYLKKELPLHVERFEPDHSKIAKHPGYSPVEWNEDNSDIVIGQHFGKEGEKNSLIFQGHTDVVSPEPVHFWSSPPYEPIVSEGRLYGRGAADMKAGLAAMIFAYQSIIKSGCQPKSNFMLQFVPDEERTGNGALATLEEGYTAKGALIPEPFGMKAAYAQVGSLWFRVKFDTFKRGSDGNHQQVNAIEKSQAIISVLKRFETKVNAEVTHWAFRDQKHPIEMNIGTIRSGDFESNVPLTGKIEGRIGLVPGETPNERKKQMRTYLRKALQDDEWFNDHPPIIEFYGFHAEGTVSDDQSALFQTLDRAHEEVTGYAPQRRTLPSTTDARFFHLYYDMDAIVYGPDGGNFHGIDEWVDLDSLKQVTKIYANLLSSWCGLEEIE